MAMNESSTSPTADTDLIWQEIRPWLDQAMRELTALDRDAILLRYFAGKDLRSVGSVLGLTEDAARKRINRSLERLREWLAAQGIKTTGAAISVALSAHAMTVAPAGLAASVTQGALVAAGTPGTLVASGIRPKSGVMSLAIPSAAVVVAVLSALGWIASINRRSPVTSTEPFASSPTLIVPTTSVAAGAPASTPVARASKLAPTTWSDSSNTVRVPKTFLNRIPLRPIMMTADEMRSLKLDETFVQLYRLTPTEQDQLKSALASALHRYRIEEGRHLEALPNPVANPAASVEAQWGVVLKEQFSFHFVQFPEQRKTLRDRFQTEIRQILGNERANYFLAAVPEVGPMIRNESDPNSTTYTFRLTDRKPLPIVDLHHQTGGSSMGLGYEAPLDQYAPESLKPVLARWRKWIAEETAKRTPLPDPPETIATAERPEQPATPPSSPVGTLWDDSAAYVDLPRNLIASLGIVAFTCKDTLTPETVEVCELTRLETQAIESLYSGFRPVFNTLLILYSRKRGICWGFCVRIFHQLEM